MIIDIISYTKHTNINIYSVDCVKHDSFRVFERVCNAFHLRLYETRFETRLLAFIAFFKYPFKSMVNNAHGTRFSCDTYAVFNAIASVAIKIFGKLFKSEKTGKLLHNSKLLLCYDT